MIKDKGRGKLHKAAILCLKDIPYPLRFLQTYVVPITEPRDTGMDHSLVLHIYYILEGMKIHQSKPF